MHCLCVPEQLRWASPREELVEALLEEDFTPWSFTKVAEEIRGNQYEDIRAEKPDVEEWNRAQDPSMEAPPTRHRITRKRPGPEPDEVPQDHDLDTHMQDLGGSASSSAGPDRGASRGPQANRVGESWWEKVPEAAWHAEECGYWTDSMAAVEIAFDLPESKRGWHTASRHLPSSFAGAMKRKVVEVCGRKLSREDRLRFQCAKEVEVQNLTAAQAFESLPKELQPSRDQAIGMLWVLTLKVKRWVSALKACSEA